MSGESIPYTVGPRRVGDVDSLVCDAGRALRELEWQPKYHIKTMCKCFHSRRTTWEQGKAYRSSNCSELLRR